MPVNPGDNCDEFPMASTYEGAAFQPVHFTASVPAAANSSQGGLTSTFYTTNRVLDGVDPFYVKAILSDGTALVAHQFGVPLVLGRSQDRPSTSAAHPPDAATSNNGVVAGSMSGQVRREVRGG